MNCREPVFERRDLQSGGGGAGSKVWRRRQGGRSRRRHIARERGLHLLERQIAGRVRGSRREPQRQVMHRFLEIGIVARESERLLVSRERLGEIALLVMNVGEAAK